jgi:cobalt-precorrin 5A hydrolase
VTGLAYIAITGKATDLAISAAGRIPGDVFSRQDPRAYAGSDVRAIEGEFSPFVGKLMSSYSGLVFIMACGIVVRSISPFLKSKTSDPAVVVMDENGENAISLLSGHLGGANELAVRIGEELGARPVITTATDASNVVSFDMVAKRNGFHIENIGSLKDISSALLGGKTVSLLTDLDVSGYVPENVAIGSESAHNVVISSDTSMTAGGASLYIRPRDLVLGIGCRRGTDSERLKSEVISFMVRNGRSIHSLAKIASVDVKCDEKAILDLASAYSLECDFIGAEEISSVEDMFECSDFVRKSVGVGAVSEPCAFLSSGRGDIVVKREKLQGITLSLAKIKMEVRF